MDAKKCDRCGKFYIPEPNSSAKPYFVKDKDNLVNRRAKDLCDECRDELKNWFDNSHRCVYPLEPCGYDMMDIHHKVIFDMTDDEFVQLNAHLGYKDNVRAILIDRDKLDPSDEVTDTLKKFLFNEDDASTTIYSKCISVEGEYLNEAERYSDETIVRAYFRSYDEACEMNGDNAIGIVEGFLRYVKGECPWKAGDILKINISKLEE